MAKIIFKKLTIEGFGSIIEEITFNLNQKGLTVLQGANGSGKTTVFSALAWVAYGKTLKAKSNPIPWAWVSNKAPNFKGTKVTLEYSKEGVQYTIVRCKDYSDKIEGAKGGNRTIFYQSGNHEKSLRDKRDVQTQINESLGMTYTLFLNTILFGQKLKRIIQETGPDKKRVFEEAFESTWINKAQELGQQEIKKLEETLQTYKNPLFKKETLLESLDTKKEMMDMFEESKEKRVKEVKDQIRDFKNEIAEFGLQTGKKYQKELAIKKPLFKQSEYDALEGNVLGIEMDIVRAEGIIKFSKSTLTEIKERLLNVKTKCKSCGQPLNAESITETKNNIKKEYKKAKLKAEAAKESLVELNVKLKDKKAKLAKLKVVKDDIEFYESKLEELEQINRKQDLIIELRGKLKKIEAETLGETFNLEEYRQLQSEVKTLRIKIKKLNRKIENYQWAIKGPLSNSGIKAYIFDAMLHQVNSQLNNYTPYVGFKITFGIDLDSARKDFYARTFIEGKGEVNYEELSGGQQQLVDICIAFSIHDVVNMNTPFNLLVLDEVFESLDEDNIEVVSELIQQKALDKSLFLVTHKTSFTALNSRSITFKLNKRGQSQITRPH